MTRPWPVKRTIVALYLVLLVLSWMSRTGRPDAAPLRAGQSAIEIDAFTAGGATRGRARFAYVDLPGAHEGLPVVLLHGSPGDGRDLETLGRLLAGKRRVIIPDLPGFGSSARRAPDYSIRAHARAVVALLDALEIERAHIVGFSMGSGVGLEVADMAADRVASITLLSGLGVVELELLGEHHVNRALHGMQLAGLWAVREFVPHFGALDDAVLGVPYARNFFDTDQRRIRVLLERVGAPALVVHGRTDFLVPLAAAEESHRLLPQSELVLFDEGHFLVFTNSERLAPPIAAFLSRADLGLALPRDSADPARAARAQLPFDPRAVPPARGVALVVLCALLALATLVSEDLACIAAGLLVAAGRLAFWPATLACLSGIVVGDVGLFLAGRVLGRAALARAPLRWFVSAASVERAGAWFARRGLALVFASRFIPGARLPTYVAAGIVRTPVLRFGFYFLIAAVLWTPVLVGIAALLGEPALRLFERFREWALLGVPLVIVGLVVLMRIVVPALTHRGRRRLFGTWLRWSRWEFWPPWLAYPPIVLAILWFGVRYRGFTLFTACNPAIDASGVIGERKHAILDGLRHGAPERVARYVLVRAGESSDARRERAHAWLAAEAITFPVVLKPDAGQRGTGVVFIDDARDLDARLDALVVDSLLQECVTGPEYGVFYARRPGSPQGTIISITIKELPYVEGDGVRTLEDLILDDARAVAMADAYIDRFGPRVASVPARGERVRLVDVGTHCRGAVFLDGRDLATTALREEIDRIARGFAGFYFGRFDVRAASPDDLRGAGAFKVIELNGVTSEATHVYDPAIGIGEAYRTLIEQWRLAFEIGAENRRAGARTAGAWSLLGRVIRYREEWG